MHSHLCYAWDSRPNSNEMKKPTLILNCSTNLFNWGLCLGNCKKLPGSGCAFSNKMKQISFITFLQFQNCIFILPGGVDALAEW